MKKRWAIPLGLFIFAYLGAPFIAGALEVGNRRGPIIYAPGYHRELFIIGCEMFREYKPREGLYQILFDRAYFYGMSERPKPESERRQIIDDLKSRDAHPRLIEELERVHREQMKRMPNQAMQTTPRSVTCCAYAQHAPARSVSDL